MIRPEAVSMTPQGEGRIPKRSEIGSVYKWRLEDMFADDLAWERECGALRASLGAMADFAGRLSESADTLLKCLNTQDDILSRSEMIFVYAKMRRDEDNNDEKYQAFTSTAVSLYSEALAAVSFIAPEILAINKGILNSFIESADASGDATAVAGAATDAAGTANAAGAAATADAATATADTDADAANAATAATGTADTANAATCHSLKAYRHYLMDILRQKAHILSEREEAMLAMATETLNAPSDIYTIFSNADLKFPNVVDENGNLVELSEGRYVRLLENSDRQVRENTFKALYNTYDSFKNTIAATLASSVKKDHFRSSARRYGSSIEASLDADMIPVSVYDGLIETVNKNLPLLHRYIRLRKKALGLDVLHMYDLYAPIVAPTDKHVPYETALGLVQEGLSALGGKYAQGLTAAIKQGWIDVFENVGKTRGAYSWGAYKSHPYILLNYQNTIDDVLTLAHELGHAMHSYYTNIAQPYVYSEYKIFVAEVASTVNEALVIEHLIKNAGSGAEKAYLLNRRLEAFRGTLFRQAMFAEFERAIHKKANAGEPLTHEVFSAVYKGLNDKYFSKEVVVDQQISLEWARIPHFYNPFYVYQYATGISAATSLAGRILSEGESAVERYMSFLSGGGSDYPLELLKRAGVDLSGPAPVEDALKAFEITLSELEALL